MSYWHCGSILVSYTRGSWLESFFCNHRYFYLPQMKFAKVMFSQVSVCLCTLNGHTPPQHAHPLGTHTPTLDKHALPLPRACTPPGTHIPWTCTTPRARMTPPGHWIRWIQWKHLGICHLCNSFFFVVLQVDWQQLGRDRILLHFLDCLS